MHTERTSDGAQQHGARLDAKRIAVFFYGSFIRREVMARGGLQPDRIEIARLSGFDIHISPHASISRSDQHSIYGILVQATHEELHTLYSIDGVGVFLAEAVIVETSAGTLQPAMCYIPPTPDNKPADQAYLEEILKAAREYGFPDWYVKKLESFR
jgi:hypothetical protein